MGKLLMIIGTVALTTFVTWQAVAFYSYPCEAFKSGYLSIGYAPGRCIK